MRRYVPFCILVLAGIFSACSPAAAILPSPAGGSSIPEIAQASEAPGSSPAAASAAAPTGSGEDIRTYVFDPQKTTASYQVDEVFFNENNRLNTAIGKTSQVTGEILLNFTQPQKSSVGEISVDISTLKSDSTRRDSAIRSRWLESQRFPLAVFKPASIEGLPEQYEPGSDIHFKIKGDLTVRDTTSPVEFDVTARLVGDTLSGTATAQVLMTDFGFSPPDIAGMLKANNEAILTLDFSAVQK